jgi:hypothetical protein
MTDMIHDEEDRKRDPKKCAAPRECWPNGKPNTPDETLLVAVIVIGSLLFAAVYAGVLFWVGGR